MPVLSDKGDIKGVVFRVDASTKIGTGHVMRCLTLADELRKTNIPLFFLCRELEGNLIEYLTSKQFNVHTLPKKSQYKIPITDSAQLFHHDWLETSWETDSDESIAAIQHIETTEETTLDWIIVDHYALDYRWENQLKKYVKNIFVIDDIADRKHNCDILLDQNLYDDMDSRYTKLTPIICRKLLGPKYALIRNEFISKKHAVKTDAARINNILIFFGGADATNETKKTLDALKNIDLTDIKVNVIVGLSNPNKEQIEDICSRYNEINFFCQINNMADYMLDADLIIGAGGINVWERCILGKPSIVITTAHNQHQQNLTLVQEGACLLLGKSNEVSSDLLSTHIQKLIDNPDRLVNISKSAFKLMENHVGTSGVVKTMHNSQLLSSLTLREILPEDEVRILEWRNSDHVRKQMHNPDKISSTDHRHWFKTVLNRSDVDYKIVEIKKAPVGVANITQINDESCHWGFYLGETETPPGTGTKLTYDFINYVFSHYNIDQIIGEILPSNVKSIDLHKKLGFTLLQNQNHQETQDSFINMLLTRDRWLSNNSDFLQI